MNRHSSINISKANIKNKHCIYCKNLFASGNIKRHEKCCSQNPNNIKICPVCNKKYSKSGKTCSYSCSNTFFRSGANNPNWNENAYRSTCWEYHDKKCIVCGEDKIVEVHHVNFNHNDNRPQNLVPLCPTHHQYVHSKYKDEVLPKIEEYINSLTITK